MASWLLEHDVIQMLRHAPCSTSTVKVLARYALHMCIPLGREEHSQREHLDSLGGLRSPTEHLHTYNKNNSYTLVLGACSSNHGSPPKAVLALSVPSVLMNSSQVTASKVIPHQKGTANRPLT